MPVNQKHITVASFNYLYEVSAIPEKTRNDYKIFLESKKGGSVQKRVKVYTQILKFVDENMISMWNPDEVCASTGIEKNALYIHKSRLLSGLRLFYFKWREKEEQVINESEHEEGSFELDMEKAGKMMELGMRKEACKLYTKLEKNFESSNHLFGHSYLIRSEILESLAYIYSLRGNINKFREYYDKMEACAAAGLLLNMPFEPANRALLEIRLNYCRYYSNFLHKRSRGKLRSFDEPRARIYELAKKHNISKYLLRVLYHMASTEHNSGNYDKAFELCGEGYRAAQHYKEKNIALVFAGFMYSLDNKRRIKNRLADNRGIINRYNALKKENPLNTWTVYLENTIIHSYYPEKRNDILKIFFDHTNSFIMYGDFDYAVYWRFVLHSETWLNNIFHMVKEGDENDIDFPVIGSVPLNYHKYIKHACLNALCYRNALKNNLLQRIVYKYMLLSYYFEEGSKSTGTIKNLIKKTESVHSGRKRTNEYNTFRLLKLAIEMLEHSASTKQMLDKYELKLKKILEGFKETPAECDTIDYAILSSLARRLRCRAVTQMVREFYQWLSAKHPEILAPVMREIEERKAKIYVVDGSKQTPQTAA